MRALTDPAASPPSAEEFKRIPSGKRLYGLLLSATDEITLNHAPPGASFSYPILGELASDLLVLAETELEKGSSDSATQLLAEWKSLDEHLGSAEARNWEVDAPEARIRLTCLKRYLLRSGLMAQREAEADAPDRYLVREEVPGA